MASNWYTTKIESASTGGRYRREMQNLLCAPKKSPGNESNVDAGFEDIDEERKPQENSTNTDSGFEETTEEYSKMAQNAEDFFGIDPSWKVVELVRPMI